jgi:hypothetical protein
MLVAQDSAAVLCCPAAASWQRAGRVAEAYQATCALGCACASLASDVCQPLAGRPSLGTTATARDLLHAMCWSDGKGRHVHIIPLSCSTTCCATSVLAPLAGHHGGLDLHWRTEVTLLKPYAEPCGLAVLCAHGARSGWASGGLLNAGGCGCPCAVHGVHAQGLVAAAC